MSVTINQPALSHAQFGILINFLFHYIIWRSCVITNSMVSVLIIHLHTFGSLFCDTVSIKRHLVFRSHFISSRLATKRHSCKRLRNPELLKRQKRDNNHMKKNPIIHKKICRHSWSPWADAMISSACSFATSTRC